MRHLFLVILYHLDALVTVSPLVWDAAVVLSAPLVHPVNVVDVFPV